MRSSIARWGLLIAGALAPLGLAAPAAAYPTTPSDQAFALQWNLQAIGAPAAWQKATGTGITIAIVDSGVDLTHEDLKDKVIGHVTCVGSNGDPTKCTDGGDDDNGHGTHVAGIAAAATNNQHGIAGVAPDAAILAVKVLSQSCDPVSGCDAQGTADDVAAGIKYAADHGAAVINLSLGNAAQSIFGPAFQEAIDYAFSVKGAIPVLAAGNNFLLPSGGALNALVVGALDRDGKKASYGDSIGDSKWALMAPGGEGDTSDSCKNAPAGILSTYLEVDGGYACLAGTSMAAPHVAGAAAILRSMGLSQQETIDRLLGTAKKMDPPAVYGAGALDLAAAVAAGPAPSSSTSTTSSVPDSSTGSDGSGAPPPASTDSSSSAPSASSSTGAPPSGDLNGPTTTGPAGVISLPGQRAAPPNGVTTRNPPKNSDVTTGLVAVAVAMAAAVCGAIGWFFVRGSNLARRTPHKPVEPIEPTDD